MLADFGNHVSGMDLEIVSAEEAREIHPLLDVKGNGVVGGMYSRTDGAVDPTSEL